MLASRVATFGAVPPLERLFFCEQSLAEVISGNQFHLMLLDVFGINGSIPQGFT